MADTEHRDSLLLNSDNLLDIGPIVNLTKMMVLHVVGESRLSRSSIDIQTLITTVSSEMYQPYSMCPLLPRLHLWRRSSSQLLTLPRRPNVAHRLARPPLPPHRLLRRHDPLAHRPSAHPCRRCSRNAQPHEFGASDVVDACRTDTTDFGLVCGGVWELG